jgi:hypothetical protein
MLWTYLNLTNLWKIFLILKNPSISLDEKMVKTTLFTRIGLFYLTVTPLYSVKRGAATARIRLTTPPTPSSSCYKSTPPTSTSSSQSPFIPPPHRQRLFRRSLMAARSWTARTGEATLSTLGSMILQSPETALTSCERRVQRQNCPLVSKYQTECVEKRVWYSDSICFFCCNKLSGQCENAEQYISTST